MHRVPSEPARRRAVTTHPIDQDIQQARMLPAVRAIVIPPCPESLLRNSTPGPWSNWPWQTWLWQRR